MLFDSIFPENVQDHFWRSPDTTNALSQYLETCFWPSQRTARDLLYSCSNLSVSSVTWHAPKHTYKHPSTYLRKCWCPYWDKPSLNSKVILLREGLQDWPNHVDNHSALPGCFHSLLCWKPWHLVVFLPKLAVLCHFLILLFSYKVLSGRNPVNLAISKEEAQGDWVVHLMDALSLMH